ncbi:MAG TPA: hypothetical protein IAB10_02875 [Candidatus Avilachnospira avistercoris]|nr:hypothetical protein [Candidatus Avilachnospira avistercoris]
MTTFYPQNVDMPVPKPLFLADCSDFWHILRHFSTNFGKKLNIFNSRHKHSSKPKKRRPAAKKACQSLNTGGRLPTELSKRQQKGSRSKSCLEPKLSLRPAAELLQKTFD